MSQLDYRHRIGGKGQAQGLPLRRGSHLYDVEPDIRYPEVVSLGTTQAHQSQYGEAVYYRPPHLPVTFIVEPYISNHKANGGNLTRRQYFTIKRGQPVMAANKREPTVGVFVDSSGTVEDRTYADPSKMATNGTIVGFNRENRYQLKDSNNAGSDPDKVITETEYNNLNSSDTASTPDQDDYKDVTEADPVSISRFESLTDAEKEGFVAVYEGLEDENDEIVTGGTNMYADVDSALFGDTDMVKNVKVDADSYYYGSVAQVQGFIFPSTGGAHRTIFYNEVDKEAGVTLPIEASSTDEPRTVQPIGNVTDVSASNSGDYKKSAVKLEAKPTIGLMHTDLEQTLSKKFHGFSTGTEERSVVKTGELLLPFLDISALETFINDRTPLTFATGTNTGTDYFNFSDQSEDLSGIKAGLYDENQIGEINKFSLLTEQDAGYANLYYNFGAPFLTAKRFPTASDKIKADLFGNYTLSDHGAFDNSSPAFGSPNNGSANVQGNVDMRSLGLNSHVVGSVQYARDVPGETLEQLRVNSIFQSRIIQDGDDRTALNEGYRRLGSTADTGGLRQMLADFGLIALGGSAEDWASGTAPQFDGLGHDLSDVLRAMVVDGVMGLVKCSFNTV